GDLTPIDHLPLPRSLVDAAAGARLEDDARARFVRDGVGRRPPRARALGPGSERVLRRAFHDQIDPKRLDQRLRSGRVFSAKSRKRAVVSPQNRSRYCSAACTPWSSRRYSLRVPASSSVTRPARPRTLRWRDTAGRLIGRSSAISWTERGFPARSLT